MLTQKRGKTSNFKFECKKSPENTCMGFKSSTGKNNNDYGRREKELTNRFQVRKTPTQLMEGVPRDLIVLKTLENAEPIEINMN